MLADLPGQQQAHGCLDLPGADGGVLVGALGGASQPSGLVGDALEDVLNERIHDAHGLLREAQALVHLLQNPGEAGGETVGGGRGEGGGGGSGGSNGTLGCFCCELSGSAAVVSSVLRLSSEKGSQPGSATWGSPSRQFGRNDTAGS